MKKTNAARKSNPGMESHKSCNGKLATHDHIHAANCGHKNYVHNGHICYEHEGHYHYRHEEHYHECSGPFEKRNK